MKKDGEQLDSGEDGSALLLVLAQVPDAPDAERWA